MKLLHNIRYLGLIIGLTLILVACGAGGDEPAEEEMSSDMAGMSQSSDEMPADLDTSTTKSSDGGLFQVSIERKLDPV
jgi:hypothetical protein